MKAVYSKEDGSWVRDWTRKEQIANHEREGTLSEMEPPLTEKEKMRL